MTAFCPTEQCPICVAADLPPAAETEHAFAEWCEQRGLDETDAVFAQYEAWIEGYR